MLFSSTASISSGSDSVSSSASLTPTSRAASENGPMQPPSTSGRDGSFFKPPHGLQVHGGAPVSRLRHGQLGGLLQVRHQAPRDGGDLVRPRCAACSRTPRPPRSGPWRTARTGAWYRACSAATASNWTCGSCDGLAHGRPGQSQARIRCDGQRQARRRCKDQPVETIASHLSEGHDTRSAKPTWKAFAY